MLPWDDSQCKESKIAFCISQQFSVVSYFLMFWHSFSGMSESRVPQADNDIVWFKLIKFIHKVWFYCIT